jgi:hypothetical protein
VFKRQARTSKSLSKNNNFKDNSLSSNIVGSSLDGSIRHHDLPAKVKLWQINAVAAATNGKHT